MGAVVPPSGLRGVDVEVSPRGGVGAARVRPEGRIPPHAGRTGLGPEGSGPKSRQRRSRDNGMDVDHPKVLREWAIHPKGAVAPLKY